MRTVGLFLFTIALTVAAALSAPAAVQASATPSSVAKSACPKTDKKVHGTVKNKLTSDVSITCSWCNATNGPCRNQDILALKPGKTSAKDIDIDGFQVPSGKRYYVEFDKLFGKDKKCVGSGWHKIKDTIVARILRTC